MAKPVDVTDRDFREVVLEAQTPFLVDFWAPWCGPCRAIAPAVEALAAEYQNRVGFAKVNVDENPTTAVSYSIHSIPTLLLFKDGKPIKQMVGLRSKAELKKDLDEAIS